LYIAFLWNAASDEDTVGGEAGAVQAQWLRMDITYGKGLQRKETNLRHGPRQEE